MMFINRSTTSNDTILNNFSPLRLLSVNVILLSCVLFPFFLLSRYLSICICAVNLLYSVLKFQSGASSLSLPIKRNITISLLFVCECVRFGWLTCFYSILLMSFLCSSMENSYGLVDRVLCESINSHKSRTWSMWEKKLFIFSSVSSLSVFMRIIFIFKFFGHVFEWFSWFICYVFSRCFYQIVASCNCIEIPHRWLDIAKQQQENDRSERTSSDGLLRLFGHALCSRFASSIKNTGRMVEPLKTRFDWSIDPLVKVYYFATVHEQSGT